MRGQEKLVKGFTNEIITYGINIKVATVQVDVVLIVEIVEVLERDVPDEAVPDVWAGP